MTTIFAGDLTQSPTYFVRPVYYGGPVDGLVGWLIEVDRLRDRQAYLHGHYVFRGYRHSEHKCGAADAVYEWEASR
jgi:hypothetical protein